MLQLVLSCGAWIRMVMSVPLPQLEQTGKCILEIAPAGCTNSQGQRRKISSSECRCQTYWVLVVAALLVCRVINSNSTAPVPDGLMFHTIMVLTQVCDWRF